MSRPVSVAPPSLINRLDERIVENIFEIAMCMGSRELSQCEFVDGLFATVKAWAIEFEEEHKHVQWDMPAWDPIEQKATATPDYYVTIHDWTIAKLVAARIG